MGHADVKTTMIYTSSAWAQSGVRSPLDALNSSEDV